MFMALSIDELYKKWDSMMDLVFSSRLKIDQDDYPPRLEYTIKRAVDQKRRGNFNEAVEIYLSIFVNEGRVFPAILDMLYKSVICTGRVDFAYEVIAYGEAFAKKAWGPISWMGPWSQETRRKELEEVLIACSNLPTSCITNGEPTKEQTNMLMDNLLKRNQLLETLMNKYSGGAEISIPSDIDAFLHHSYALFNSFRKGRIIDDSVSYRVEPITEERHDTVESHEEKREDYSQQTNKGYKTTKFYMKAVGVTFGNRQRVISRLKVGQQLRFVPEPNNPYDSFAVKIETLDGEQIGYISKDHNQDVFNNIRSGKAKYNPVVSSLTGGGFGTAYGVNIEVTMTELY